MELSSSVLKGPASLDADEAMRVLVIDDSEVIRRRLVERLELVGGVQIVGEAPDAWQALESIKRFRPHFVTLDIRMPGGDGLTLLRELREMEHAPLVAVVTNYATPEYRRCCRALGAFAVLDKSSQIDELLLLVEKVQRESTSLELGA